MQAPCIYPQAVLTQRKLLGLYLSCFGVFIYFLTTITFHYTAQVQRTKYKHLKRKQLTAADYTVNFKINQGMFDHFEYQYYNNLSPLSKIAQCKLYFKHEFETRLNHFQSVFSDSFQNDQIRIAVVTFAFNIPD